MEVIVEVLTEPYEESNRLLEGGLGVAFEKSKLDHTVRELLLTYGGELLYELRGHLLVVIQDSWG
jgi:hypothetical protein